MAGIVNAADGNECPECNRPIRPCRDCELHRCRQCNCHVRIDADATVVVPDVSASEIAHNVGTIERPADEEGLAFGKVFEEAYAKYWYRRKHGGFDGWGSLTHAYYPKRAFGRRVAAMLRDRDIYSDEYVAHAVRLFSAFLAADVRGLTPATRHRPHGNLVVYAKPDLAERSADPSLTEFKTAPIDEYARIQTAVMAWVFDEPIRLVGARTDQQNGWVEVESERVDPDSDPIETFRSA